MVGNVIEGRNLTFMHFSPKQVRQPSTSGICSELNECDLDCLNCTNNASQLNGEFFRESHERKKLAVISQSGAVLSALASALPVSTGLSVGNSSQLQTVDYVDYCVRKEHQVIVVYVEKMDARQFEKLRQLVQSNKDTHFILYKSANTQKGVQRA